MKLKYMDPVSVTVKGKLIEGFIADPEYEEGPVLIQYLPDRFKQDEWDTIEGIDPADVTLDMPELVYMVKESFYRAFTKLVREHLDMVPKQYEDELREQLSDSSSVYTPGVPERSIGEDRA